MRTRAHRFVAGLALAAAVGLLAGPGAAGEKDKVWKQFLPAETYQELVKRAAKNAEEALAGSPNEEAIKRPQFNALMIAAYTKSTRGGNDTHAVQQTAPNPATGAATQQALQASPQLPPIPWTGVTE